MTIMDTFRNVLKKALKSESPHENNRELIEEILASPQIEKIAKGVATRQLEARTAKLTRLAAIRLERERVLAPLQAAERKTAADLGNWKSDRVIREKELIVAHQLAEKAYMFAATQLRSEEDALRADLRQAASPQIAAFCARMRAQQQEIASMRPQIQRKLDNATGDSLELEDIADWQRAASAAILKIIAAAGDLAFEAIDDKERQERLSKLEQQIPPRYAQRFRREDPSHRWAEVGA